MNMEHREHAMLCYMDICIAPPAEGYTEALSA